MQIDPTIATLIGTAIGAVAGIGGAIATTIITQRAEERRHTRELSFNAALDNWKRLWDEFTKRGTGTMMPLEVFLIHMIRLSDLLNERKITVEVIEAHMREVHAVTERASQLAAEKNKADEKDA